MPSYMIRGLPVGLIARAKARARADETTLDQILIAALTRYAAQGRPGHVGAKARSASLSAAERSEIARTAAKARWQK